MPSLTLFLHVYHSISALINGMESQGLINFILFFYSKEKDSKGTTSTEYTVCFSISTACVIVYATVEPRQAAHTESLSSEAIFCYYF